MGSIYNYLGADERFRALAYSKAANVIEGLDKDIRECIKKEELEEIPGIGEGIAGKIREYIRTGKIRKYEELKRKVPHELLELMNISGFGPKSLKKIHDELKINTKEKLIEAIENGSIMKLSGFGTKKVENMKRGLKLHKQSEERITLWRAMEIWNSICEKLKRIKEVIQMEVAGSIRRRKETIGDIDILISCKSKDRKKIVDEFISLKGVKTLLARGLTRASIVLEDANRQVDLRLVNEEEWGAAMLYFTGSKEHNIVLRTLAKKKGYKINEYGVFRLKYNKRIAGKSELEIYKLFGFSYIPPEMRECKGELELAARNEIPELITLDNIKGDMQMHSDWSDGSMNIEELAKFVLKNYRYDYIVLTDHSKSERIAGGMNENEFLKQIKKIDSINQKLGVEFIKKGVEVDILSDGKLDLDDKLLSQMDWVCASIHSGFKSDNTDRLINACNNPFVNCIGHPMGRLIGKREAYPVDWERVFKIASATGTVLEINAQPERMDLNDELARQARDAGVMLSISTDAHAAPQFGFMALGVFVARRAWCTAKDVLNTRSWKEIETMVKAKRKIKPKKVTNRS